MLRYSLGSLFLSLLYLSIQCAALVNANGIWPQVAVSLTIAVLALFTLVAVFGSERWRVFAIAFSATGWLYMLLAFSQTNAATLAEQRARAREVTSSPFGKVTTALHFGGRHMECACY